ncbi:MAG: hypothetical protein U0T84_13660 [Chitinophagales bacterium]
MNLRSVFNGLRPHMMVFMLCFGMVMTAFAGSAVHYFSKSSTTTITAPGLIAQVAPHHELSWETPPVASDAMPDGYMWLEEDQEDDTDVDAANLPDANDDTLAQFNNSAASSYCFNDGSFTKAALIPLFVLHCSWKNAIC